MSLLLGGLGLLAGVFGAGGHLSAKETNEKAQRISQEAQVIYNDAKRSLEVEKEKTEKKLVQLGISKKHILDTSMRQFLQSYDKVKNVQMKDVIGLNEISKFSIDQQGVLEIRQLTDVYSSSIKSGAAGAATGAVVALAASGSLGFVTSGLSVAGSMLVAGEVGMAASAAGTALSFGAAMTPLAAVAAPVVLFTGISASMKADENLEKANAMYAEAKAACEKMRISETLCNAISERSEMFDALLGDLNKMFEECSELLAGVIKKKEGIFFKKKLSSTDFSENDLKLLAVTRALAGAVKAVIDTPILSNEGEITYESEQVYVDKLPDFNRQVEEMRHIEFHISQVETKLVKASKTTQETIQKVTTVIGGARNVMAIVLGVILASILSGYIAGIISTYGTKVLFVKSYTANNIAVWLMIFTSIVMLIGKSHNIKIRICCGILSGIAMFVLYIQYVRTVEQMKHYIIFSIAIFVGCLILQYLFDTKGNEEDYTLYFAMMVYALMGFPILFVIYDFFALFLGYSSLFWLVVTSIVMLLGAPLIMVAPVLDEM